MLFKELGNKQNKAIILIHGYGILVWFQGGVAGEKYANSILSKFPSVKIKVFKGFDHGELCIGNPDLYLKEVTELLNS